MNARDSSARICLCALCKIAPAPRRLGRARARASSLRSRETRRRERESVHRLSFLASSATTSRNHANESLTTRVLNASRTPQRPAVVRLSRRRICVVTARNSPGSPPLPPSPPPPRGFAPAEKRDKRENERRLPTCISGKGNARRGGEGWKEGISYSMFLGTLLYQSISPPSLSSLPPPSPVLILLSSHFVRELTTRRGQDDTKHITSLRGLLLILDVP